MSFLASISKIFQPTHAWSYTDKKAHENRLALLGQHQCLERVIDFIEPIDRVNLLATGPEMADYVLAARAFAMSFQGRHGLTVKTLSHARGRSKRTARAIDMYHFEDRSLRTTLPGYSFSRVPETLKRQAIVFLETALSASTRREREVPPVYVSDVYRNKGKAFHRQMNVLYHDILGLDTYVANASPQFAKGREKVAWWLAKNMKGDRFYKWAPAPLELDIGDFLVDQLPEVLAFIPNLYSIEYDIQQEDVVKKFLRAASSSMRRRHLRLEIFQGEPVRRIQYLASRRCIELKRVDLDHLELERTTERGTPGAIAVSHALRYRGPVYSIDQLP